MARQLRFSSRKRAMCGFSLIELMVGITIALIVTLAIFNVLVASETRKRSTTAVNDINQSGAYSAYVMDRAIRSAGSGFTNQRITLLLGADFESCTLNITRGGAAIAPRTTNFDPPFDIDTLRRPVLAPVIIDAGTNSDVITVMSGSQGQSEIGNRVIAPSATGVAITNTFAFKPGDLVLFARNATEGDCVVSQVDDGFAPQVPPTIDAVNQSLPLDDGNYVSGVNATTLVGTRALGLGNETVNRPQFKMFAVDQTEQTLRTLDLFNFEGFASDALRGETLAEGVVEMRAIYGVDTDDNNTLDTWIAPDPVAAGAWSGTTLRNGSVTSSANLRRIVAIRLALVLRTGLEEREAVAARNSFSIFGDVSTARTVPTVVPTNAANFRYRVIETTIPLRNNLL